MFAPDDVVRGGGEAVPTWGDGFIIDTLIAVPKGVGCG